jgi:S-ribosylhomocysteine lyase LuxS involved in autoinducer biosynthesis
MKYTSDEIIKIFEENFQPIVIGEKKEEVPSTCGKDCNK